MYTTDSVKVMKKPTKLQNITLSAEKELIEMARRKAKASRTTLNQEFRNWLMQFTRSTRPEGWFIRYMEKFNNVDSGGKFKRSDFYEE